MDLNILVENLTNAGVEFETGLTEAEFFEIENIYNIKFPPDLREFLKAALPISDGFINWRDNSKDNIVKIKNRLNWTLEGIIFDIESNSFWMDSWGTKPSTIKNSIAIAKQKYREAPKLIPIYSHRYISSYPAEKNNPIMSVYQTDIIYYGENLETYLLVEFGLKNYDEIDFNNIKRIKFWSDIIE